ncbi:MAG: hypothetical protein M5U19_12855 [Microthrixaceae bacterium]|nr:hypothetical protein [Microthrixaceae bacterium]
MNATPQDPDTRGAQRRTAGGEQGRSGGRTEGARKVDVDTLLRRAVDMIEAALGIPMSASVRVNRDDLLDLLDEAIAALPDELRAARWLLKERDEYLARTRREAEELIAEARTQVAHMVQKAEVVKAAEQRARHVNEEAEANARRMRREAEDFCDQRLASFENVLAKVQRSVAVGRQRLAAPTIEESELSGFDDGDEPLPGGRDDEPGGSVPFDQER